MSAMRKTSSEAPSSSVTSHRTNGNISSRVLFFLSSRSRHTRFDCDCSSDVCSSDLFGARDPNLYGYVLNNPVSLTDPLGLDPCVEMTSAGQIIVDNTIADRAAGFINEAVEKDRKSVV